MLPQNPPQPSCSYLAFQPAPSGIQTSSLMVESLVGVDVTATRQKGGRPVRGVVEPGGVNVPPVIDWAAVIEACGKERLDRLSQVAALAGLPMANTAASEIVDNNTPFQVMFIVVPPDRPCRCSFALVGRPAHLPTMWTILRVARSI